MIGGPKATVRLEIDAGDLNSFYQHVDGLCALKYFNFGRKALQEMYGISDEQLFEQGLGFFIRDYDFRSREEIRSLGVEVRSSFGRRTPLTFFIEHSLVCDGKLCIEGTTEHFFARLADRNFSKPPQEFIGKLETGFLISKDY